MVPVVLGFVPEDSLVMLTFGAAQAFHARVDLPPDAGALREVVAALLGPAVRHGVQRVLLVAYTPDLRLAERVTGRVRDAFERRRIEVLGRLVADGRCWWPLPREAGDPGRPYDVSAHRFAAEAVMRGLVTHGSRADLSATLASEPERVAEVIRALATRSDRGQPAAEAGWAAATVRRCVADGAGLSTDETARLLAGMRDLTVRDAAWTTLTRADAVRHVAFWTDVVRRSPDSHVAAPAAVLGFAAWVVRSGGTGVVRGRPVPRGRSGLPPRGPPRRQPGRRVATVGVGRGARRVGPRAPRLSAESPLGSAHGRRGRGTGVHARRSHPAPREGAALPGRVRPDAARGALRHRRPDDRARGRAQPRGRAQRPGPQERRGARGDRRPRLPDRAGPVQHRDQRRAGQAPRGWPGHLRGEPATEPQRRREQVRRRRRAPGDDRHPADPRRGPHGAELDQRQPALPAAQRADPGGPRGGHRDRDQRPGPADDDVREHPPGGGLHEHPVPRPDLARGLRGVLERLAGDRRRPARHRRQLAVPPRQAAVARDPDPALRAGRRHPQRGAQGTGGAPPRVVRRALDHLGLRPVRGERPLLPGAAADHRGGGPPRGPRGGRRPQARRAAAAQRHDLPVEPPGLRHRRGSAPPAGREPHPGGRSDGGRHHRQRRVLLRAGAGPGRQRAPPVVADVVQRRRGELPRRRAAGHRRPALLARHRPRPRHRAGAAPPAAAGPRGAARLGHAGGGLRPAARRDRAALQGRHQRRRVVRREDGRTAPIWTPTTPSGPRPASTARTCTPTTRCTPGSEPGSEP